MADATAFNLTADIEAARKLMTTWVNVGTKSSKEWECVGVGVEDSSIETKILLRLASWLIMLQEHIDAVCLRLMGKKSPMMK